MIWSNSTKVKSFFQTNKTWIFKMKQIKKIKKTTIKWNNNQHQINKRTIQMKIRKILNSII